MVDYQSTERSTPASAQTKCTDFFAPINCAESPSFVGCSALFWRGWHVLVPRPVPLGLESRSVGRPRCRQSHPHGDNWQMSMSGPRPLDARSRDHLPDGETRTLASTGLTPVRMRCIEDTVDLLVWDEAEAGTSTSRLPEWTPLRARHVDTCTIKCDTGDDLIFHQKKLSLATVPLLPKMPPSPGQRRLASTTPISSTKVDANRVHVGTMYNGSRHVPT
ncbi:unnamed protein product [Protopolystoma xenopodis]|uniref:Uncharacterized protein n=1 Tax=Protopolystoma xenopodis TaxID=117903 RepID=A0A448WYV3_9PLAT|nr:unnamed protein product [Protopolystoma xenopodis]